MIGNEKTIEMLHAFYDSFTDNLIAVKDGEELEIGSKTSAVLHDTNGSLARTMMTLEKTTGVLFSGDAFEVSAHFNGGIFDDEVDVDFFW